MPKIPIEISARHCHLSQKDADKLFGTGYVFKKLKDLSQPGEYATKDTITLKTKAGELSLRVLMPVRSASQIELAKSDAYKLKINPPVRISGDLAGTLGGNLVGSIGTIRLKQGIIIAQRHFHCSPDKAKLFGVRKGQKISVKTTGERALTFHNVIVRVSDKYGCSMHIDVDEGNAGLVGGVCGFGVIVK